MHLYCTGTGAPTIVLDASGGTGFYMWHAIQPLLARDYRVCSYDRPGTAFRDPRPGYSKPVAGLLADLHELLRRGGEKPPFVVAGHSLGGFFAWKYAERYPEDVAGVVLLDAAIPGSGKARPLEMVAAIEKAGAEARAKADRRIEEWRKNGQWGEMYLPKDLPADWRPRLLALTKTQKWWETRFKPLTPDYDEPFRPLAIPVTVVTATRRTRPPGIPNELYEKAVEAHVAFVDALLAPMKPRSTCRSICATTSTRTTLGSSST